MAFIQELLSALLQTFLWALLQQIGAFLRWLFFRRQLSFEQVLEQNWNGRIGLLFILCLFSIGYVTYWYAHRPEQRLKKARLEVRKLLATHQLKDGDIIFQTSLSSQSKAIQLATHSTYSHCGIIFCNNSTYYVCEAIQPVSITPLDVWIARGKNGHYVIKRLRHAQTVLTTAAYQRMRETAKPFLGKNYDLTFEWSDDRIYCSELIWKIYHRATGIEISKPEKLGDFDLSAPRVQQKLKARYGNFIPLTETVVSPAAIYNSDKLINVQSN